jgi:hypothetical protein
LPGNAGFDDFSAMLQRTAGDRNAGGGIPHRFAFNDAGCELQPIHESDAMVW